MAGATEGRKGACCHLLEKASDGGLAGGRLREALHERLAAPLTTAMLLFLTVALARPPPGRATHTARIAGGLGGGFLLWNFDGLVSNLRDLGLLPPILAAWAPVAVIVVSVVLHDHGSRRMSAMAPARGAGPRAAQVDAR
jgi:lipopolysaccharide export LptBFGC system permease protein LptF